MFCSLQQEDGRESKDDGSYSKYPFKDRIVSAMLFLFELPDSMNRLEEYGKPAPIEKATPKVLHEISMRVKLKAGKKYVIVPSPRKAGTLGKFSLSIYTSCSQTEYDVTRLDKKGCLYHFIKEEYDKNERRVPAWKIKWCKDNLSNMIGKDDDGVNLSSSMIKTQKTTMSKKRMSLKKQKTGKKSKMQKSVETNLADKAQKALAAAQEESEEDEDMA